MKFAVCNEMFGDWPFEKAFRFAKECGYTGVEFAPFTMGANALDIGPGKREEVRGLLEELDLEPIGLHWLLAKTEGYYLTSPEEPVREHTGEYLAELARLCRDLGGTIMVLGSPQQRNLLPGVSHDDAMGFAADVIQRAEPVLRECGVTLALEPLGPAEGDFMNTAEVGVQLVDRIGSPNVELHLDVKAMASESKPIDAIIRDSVPHITHFHVNDPNLLGPGMGEVEYEPIFKALKEVDYDGWLSLEVFDYDPGPEHICRESMRYMLEILDRIG